jgi:hypothetical protein
MPTTIGAMSWARGGRRKISMPKVAVPTAPMPVQAAYAVPTGSAFSDSPRSTKLAQAAAIVTAVKCHLLKPSEAFIVSAQTISSRPATSRIHHAAECVICMLLKYRTVRPQ